MFPCFSRTYTGHSFRNIWMKLCRHICLGGYIHVSKNFRGRTPLGEILPKFFFEISIWPRKKYAKKCFGPDPPGLGGIASKLLEWRFSNVYRLQFYRYLDEILQAHYARGTQSLFKIIWGLGEIFFPKRYRSENLREPWPWPRKKYEKNCSRSEP